jgi:hypothetical protein
MHVQAIISWQWAYLAGTVLYSGRRRIENMNTDSTQIWTLIVQMNNLTDPNMETEQIQMID